METTSLKKLNIDEVYSISDIKEMELKHIENAKMNYEIYEKSKRIYFFEKQDDQLYRLYCITSKSSFYL